MKFLNRKALAAAAFAFGAAAAPAAAQTEFTGGGFLSGWNAACAGSGWGGVVQVTARVRPGGLPGNLPNHTTVNLFFDSATMHFRYRPLANGTWSTTASAITLAGAFAEQTDPRPRVRARAAPAGTTASGSELHMVADIQHFGQTRNCIVQMNLWLRRS